MAKRKTAPKSPKKSPKKPSKRKPAKARGKAKPKPRGHTIVLIPGDGIGPEVTDAAVEIIEAAGVRVRWRRFEAGSEVALRMGSPLPDDAVDAITRTRVALKGPITTPSSGGYTSPNVMLRQRLHLYANFRPVRSIPSIKTRFDDIDLLIVRENTEDLYSGKEHVVVPGVVESLKIITAEASSNIARFAFKVARREGRSKVTAIHKANIMKLSDGLFLECCRDVARHYADIEYEECIVDNACMQLVTNPGQFDVLLLENLYGDIVSDLCAGMIGGLGVVPGANYGDKIAVFEAVHGSAPDIAGRGIANPTAVIRSSILMLQHLREDEAAERVWQALLTALKSKKARTPDLGGRGTTRTFTDAIIAGLG